MDHERRLLQEKREQEKDYLRKMLEENERNKAKQEGEREKERFEDVAAQEEYSKMLEKQEKDRQREFQAREQRAQDFMNRLASNVIKSQHERQLEEKEILNRYEAEKEMRMRLEDERRM